MEEEKHISELRKERLDLISNMSITRAENKTKEKAMEYKRKHKRLKEVSSELYKLTNNPIYLIK